MIDDGRDVDNVEISRWTAIPLNKFTPEYCEQCHRILANDPFETRNVGIALTSLALSFRTSCLRRVLEEVLYIPAAAEVARERRTGGIKIAQIVIRALWDRGVLKTMDCTVIQFWI